MSEALPANSQPTCTHLALLLAELPSSGVFTLFLFYTVNRHAQPTCKAVTCVVGHCYSWHHVCEDHYRHLHFFPFGIGIRTLACYLC